MESNGMKLVNGYPTKSTFYHHNQKSTSQIDYIMHKSKEKAMEYRVKILDLEPFAFDDALLISLFHIPFPFDFMVTVFL
jgi:hypothetical protein